MIYVLYTVALHPMHAQDGGELNLSKDLMPFFGYLSSAAFDKLALYEYNYNELG